MVIKLIKLPPKAIANMPEIENQLALLPATTNQIDSISTFSIGSFNGIYVKRQQLRSEEEYQAIFERMGNETFTIEDMKWIDLNVYENSTEMMILCHEDVII